MQLGVAYLLGPDVSLPARAEPTHHTSSFIRVDFRQDTPALAALAVDSLGRGDLRANVLAQLPARPAPAFEVRRNERRAEYRAKGMPVTAQPIWRFETSERQIHFQSSYSPGIPAPPLVMDFDLRACHATLLGLMNNDGRVRLPALLHFPDHGTFRVTSNAAPEILCLGYETRRCPAPRQKEKYVRVSFPGASQGVPYIEYTLDVVTIHPRETGIEKDARFDGFRRNFLNIFQLNPKVRALANNTGSDACAITVYEYAEVALRTPPLATDLTALDLLRQTLDRYLSGMKGCGMKGYHSEAGGETGYDFLDAYPSLVIAGTDYALGSKDASWLQTNYPGLQAWAQKMLEFDRDGDGLLEYAQTPDSGPWPWNHPPNWWDTIWFTNKDAYSNALAYRACLGMAEVANLAENRVDHRYYSACAAKLRSAYSTTFYNPATGVLAGWKDARGRLHDYYFTFVNGMAITYGLVPYRQANAIMDRLFMKMNEVGYDHFDFGLPGNLVPIRKEDYLATAGKEWGGPQGSDGSDAFQNYENGGATACFVGFTIEALYRLGRRQDADRILFAILRAFEDGGFQGWGSNGRSYDWKRWDGTPKGYEGFLADGYMTLLAVLSRQSPRKSISFGRQGQTEQAFEDGFPQDKGRF